MASTPLRRSARIAARTGGVAREPVSRTDMVLLVTQKPLSVQESAAVALDMNKNQEGVAAFRECVANFKAMLSSIETLKRLGADSTSLNTVQYELFRYVYSGDVIDLIREKSPKLLSAILDTATRLLDQLMALEESRGLDTMEKAFLELLMEFSRIRA